MSKAFNDARVIQTRIHSLAYDLLLHHKAWGPEYCYSQLNGFIAHGDPKIDPRELTTAEMDTLGFGVWDEPHTRLIPEWLHPFLEPTIEVTDIFGKHVAGVENIDNDSRQGMLAYWVPPADTVEAVS